MYVSAVRSVTLARFLSVDFDDEVDMLWEREVPAGETQVCFARIVADSALPGGDWYEGIWLFAADRPYPEIKQWLLLLNGAGRDDQPGVLRDQALSLLEVAMEPTRGGPLGKISAEHREALRAAVEDYKVRKSDQFWPLTEPRLRQFLFRADFSKDEEAEADKAE